MMRTMYRNLTLYRNSSLLQQKCFVPALSANRVLIIYDAFYETLLPAFDHVDVMFS